MRLGLKTNERSKNQVQFKLLAGKCSFFSVIEVIVGKLIYLRILI
jgi:hypothetical protein